MMQKFSRYGKHVVLAFVAALLALNVQSAMAGMVGNEQLAQQSAMEARRGEVEAFMARADVARTLTQYGVDAADVEKRVASLSDSEVLQIHEQIADLPAGQDSFLGAVLVIIVIFMLLDMAGVTDIFPAI